MAAPQRFAQVWGQQQYTVGQQVAQMYYDAMMQERAARLNTLELIKSCQDGEVDLAQVKVNDDGFEIMPPKPVNIVDSTAEEVKPRGRSRK